MSQEISFRKRIALHWSVAATLTLISLHCVTKVGNQPAPYRGLPGPPGPKCRKSLENVSRGLRPRNPKKSPKIPGTLKKHSPDTFRRLSGDFPDCPRDFFETFWGPGAGGPGRHFRDSFGISGPEGPRELCKGRAGSQH